MDHAGGFVFEDIESRLEIRIQNARERFHHYLDIHEGRQGLTSRVSKRKVILIDGAHVAQLMFEYGVGVSTEDTYVVKRIDSDFFEDEGRLRCCGRGWGDVAAQFGRLDRMHRLTSAPT